MHFSLKYPVLGALAALVGVEALTINAGDSRGSSVDPLKPIHSLLQHDAELPDFNEPLREIELGSLNFLQTTDTHGWYLGHLNQRQYSSDWGDFISFSENLKENAAKQGGDLLIVDTGDRHDGNGLSDLTFPHGELSDVIFQKADYDLVTVGNHELYEADVSQYEYEHLVPHYGERFISTNVEYQTDSGEWKIFGNNTHRYFETEVNGYKVLALSFMFDFTRGNERVRVTPIAEMIHKKELNDLLEYYSTSQPVDIVVIFGHLPPARDWTESLVLHRHIRSYFPDTVIQYFGGHSHIRDFAVYDELSTGLQSGRYCETVGFLSLKNFTDVSDPVDRAAFIENNLQRRYIDFNLHSFMHHSNKSSFEEFATKNGLAASRSIQEAATELKLQDTYGYVPHNFYMSAANYYDKKEDKSLLRFLETEIVTQLEPKICDLKQEPYVNAKNNSRSIIVNTGSVRYDLYKGAFTRNALFTVSPFSNKWKVIADVPRKVAARLQGILNAGPYIMAEGDVPDLEGLLSPYQAVMNERTSKLSKRSQASTDQSPLSPKLSYGYTTVDELGNDGDDTVHRNIPNFHVPNVIQSFEGGSEGRRTPLTDVVFYDFIEDRLLWALKVACGANTQLYETLASSSTYYNDCAKEYNVGHLLKKYVEEHWSSAS